MLEDRDDVGESLVEGEDILVGRLQRARAQAVDEGVGYLVGDDVV